MKSRGSWGIVYVAVIFALIAVGVASGTYYFEKKAKQNAIVSVAKTVSDWHGLSDIASSSASSDSSSVSQAVSEDLYTQYANLTAQGTFTTKERDQMLADIAAGHVSEPPIVPNISLTDLNLQATTSLSSYLQLVAVILAQSGRVKEYELNVFARSVENNVTSGTQELADDAALYQEIGTALLIMDTPPAVAPQHLELVKSVGALAKATALLATWNGDPINGLVYVDAFNKAEAYVTASVNAVVATVQKLQQSS